MKILCLLDAFWPDYGGGIVKALVPEIEQLARDGHEVVVLARRLLKGSPDFEDRGSYWFFRYGTVSLGLASGPVSTQFHLPAMLRELHGRYHFDVVYANHFQQARVAEAELGIPVLMSYHASAHREIDIDLNYGKYGARAPLVRCANQWVRHVESSAIAHSALLMTRSQYMTDDLRELYPRLAARNIVQLPLCVDLARYAFEADPRRVRPALNLPAERLILFTVRRLVPRMGLDKLIAAMRQIREAYPEVLLLIGGKGPLEHSLQKQIVDAGLQDHIRMLGFIAEEDLASYYQSSDLFVLPTMAYEGFGLVTLESWSCGTPVVCTPVGANPEVVGAFGKEWVMKSGEVSGIVEGISRVMPLLKDTRLRRSCRDYCEANFSPAKIVQELEVLLASMIKQT